MWLFSFLPSSSKFLRQGCYSEEGDIVVLCAYLGQLARLRDALAGEVAIIIDERDQAALADQEGDKEEEDVEVAIEHVKITKRVFLIVLNYDNPCAKCFPGSPSHRGQLPRGRGQGRQSPFVLSSHCSISCGFARS